MKKLPQSLAAKVLSQINENYNPLESSDVYYYFKSLDTKEEELKEIRHYETFDAWKIKKTLSEHIYHPNGGILLNIKQPCFDIFYAAILHTPSVPREQSYKDWKWQDRSVFLFGKLPYEQTGEIRKKVFQEAMDLYLDVGKITIDALFKLTGQTKHRLMTELHAINIQLIEHGIPYYFVLGGKGFYILKFRKIKKKVSFTLDFGYLKRRLDELELASGNKIVAK